MPKLVFDNGVMVVKVRYLTTKPDGSYVFQRRVPNDLKEHYEGRTHLKVYLGRLTPSEAAKRVKALVEGDNSRQASLRAHPTSPAHVAAKVDARLDRWRKEPVERLDDGDWPTEAEKLGDMLDDHLTDTYGDAYYDLKTDPRYAKHFDKALQAHVSPEDYETYRRIMAMRPDAPREQPTLSKVLEAYFEGKDDAFRRKSAAGVTRHLRAVYGSVGDRPLGHYEREHARKVRDAMIEQGLSTASVRRALNDIKAVFNHGRLEFDLQSVPNPFEKLKIANEGDDAGKRIAFTVPELSTIAGACRSRNDDAAHIVSLMVETGARLEEIVGLRTEDVFLDAAIPYVHIRPHKHLGRTIKTTASIRKVPLIGVALWAAQAASKESLWLFPRYAEDHKIKAGSASARLNPWLKSLTGTQKTTHCFRHAMEDRLREKEVAEDIQQAIVGHKRKDEHRKYGEGYPLDVLVKHMISIAVPS